MKKVLKPRSLAAYQISENAVDINSSDANHNISRLLYVVLLKCL